MSNTMKRVISAVVMVGVLLGILYLGRKATDTLLLVLGALVIDEILHNLLKIERRQLTYWSAEILYLGSFFFFVFLDPSITFIRFFNNAALVNNIILLLYLFYVKMDNKEILSLFKNIPYLISLYILFPFISLAFLVAHAEWLSLLLVLFLINFGMDTGAWFVGKNLGRHKLWPTVSPNKTVEGLVGGVVIAGLAGSLGWYFSFHTISFLLFLSFSFLGLLSQLGDLVQSKLKRQGDIKDSSQLIPGHGGVYDRLDSLIFVTPFFILLIDYFSH